MGARSPTSPRRSFASGLTNEVTAQILGLLQEYHVLDSEYQPSAQYFMHEIRRELQGVKS